MTHDVNTEVSEIIGNPNILMNFGWPSNLITPTQEILQTIFEIHQPKLWIHAHFHKNYTMKYGETKFIGLGELEYVDIDKNLNIQYCSANLRDLT